MVLNRQFLRSVSAADGQLAVFAVVRTSASPDALVKWTRSIVELKRSPTVLAAGRFSANPGVADVAGLELDAADLDAVRRCRPGDCLLKLTVTEMERLRRAVGDADGDWRERTQREFRHLLVDRVHEYRAGGLVSIRPVADGTEIQSLHENLEAIVASTSLLRRMPVVQRWLREPAADTPIESFVYWSKERYARGKAIITVTHVGIVKSPADEHAPPVVVISKQILSTRYVNGALGITAIVSDEDGQSYLAYLNRSRPDLLRGVLGRMLRGTVDSFARRDAPAFVRLARKRLEGGDPPPPVDR